MANILGNINIGESSKFAIKASASTDQSVKFRLRSPQAQLKPDGDPIVPFEFDDRFTGKLPQGLKLQEDGEITGTVQFNSLTSIDRNNTTFYDTVGYKKTVPTEFDRLYKFWAEAYTDNLSADREYAIRVTTLTYEPWQELYLVANPPTEWENFVNNSSIFIDEVLYRPQDSNFGRKPEPRMLVKSGLNVKSIDVYRDLFIKYDETDDRLNFIKRLHFGDVKSARAYNTVMGEEYEVIYYEVVESDIHLKSSSLGNGLDWLRDQLENEIGEVIHEENFLPDWMYSNQKDGKVLGFKFAVPLAYVLPGEAERILYRIRENDFNPNQFVFNINRFQLVDISNSYDIPQDRFVDRSRTTFDESKPIVTGGTGTGAAIRYMAVNQDGQITDIEWHPGSRDYVVGDELTFTQGKIFGSYTLKAKDITGTTLNSLINVTIIPDSGKFRGNSTTFDNDQMTFNDVVQEIIGNGEQTEFSLNYSVQKSSDVAVFGPGQFGGFSEITNENPAVVTTKTPHGLENGAKIQIIGITGYGGVYEQSVGFVPFGYYSNTSTNPNVGSVTFNPYTTYPNLSQFTGNVLGGNGSSGEDGTRPARINDPQTQINVNINLGYVFAVYFSDSGLGYKVGDVIELERTNESINNLTPPALYQLTEEDVNDDGSLNTLINKVIGENVMFVTADSSGSGAIINQPTNNSINSVGQITNVTWNNKGSGYSSGDTLTFSQTSISYGTRTATYTLQSGDLASGRLRDFTGKTIGDVSPPGYDYISQDLKNTLNNQQFYVEPVSGDDKKFKLYYDADLTDSVNLSSPILDGPLYNQGGFTSFETRLSPVSDFVAEDQTITFKNSPDINTSRYVIYLNYQIKTNQSGISSRWIRFR